MVGNQQELYSVSPCVHIWRGLLGSVPNGLIKYKPLESVIAAPPSAFNSLGLAMYFIQIWAVSFGFRRALKEMIIFLPS